MKDDFRDRVYGQLSPAVTDSDSWTCLANTPEFLVSKALWPPSGFLGKPEKNQKLSRALQQSFFLKKEDWEQLLKNYVMYSALLFQSYQT